MAYSSQRPTSGRAPHLAFAGKGTRDRLGEEESLKGAASAMKSKWRAECEPVPTLLAGSGRPDKPIHTRGRIRRRARTWATRSGSCRAWALRREFAELNARFGTPYPSPLGKPG
jgi:hypothetical protein